MNTVITIVYIILYLVDDSDFVSTSNDLITIQSNSTSASYDITILGDIIPEIDEHFTFNITTVNPADQVVPPSQGTIMIIDNDEGKHLDIMHCAKLLMKHNISTDLQCQIVVLHLILESMAK